MKHHIARMKDFIFIPSNKNKNGFLPKINLKIHQINISNCNTIEH